MSSACSTTTALPGRTATTISATCCSRRRKTRYSMPRLRLTRKQSDEGSIATESGSTTRAARSDSWPIAPEPPPTRDPAAALSRRICPGPPAPCLHSASDAGASPCCSSSLLPLIATRLGHEGTKRRSLYHDRDLGSFLDRI